MANWFNETHRKVHLLYVSPQWVRDRGAGFDPVAYAEGYTRAGVDCVEVYVKDHHGNVYFPCSTGIPYPRDVVGELLPELKKRGIRMIAYFSICFDNHALGLHPDWRAVNHLGDPQKTGPFFVASVSSPYRDFIVRQIEEFAARYDVDGYWLDIIPLAREAPQRLWMIQQHPLPDCSLHAQRRWRAATGQVLPRHPTPDEADRIFEFMTGEVSSLLDEMYAAIRRHQPDAVITYNAAGALGDPIDSADLTSIEGHAPNHQRQSFISRWARGSGKPYEMMTASGLPRVEPGAGWNALDPKPVTMLRLEAAIALAQGGSTLIGQVPYASGATDPAQFEGLGRVFRPIREIEPYVRGAKSIAEVALVAAVKPREASTHWYRMQDAAEHAHQALVDEHLQFDIVRRTESLERYSMVVLSEQTALSDAELDRLRSFVEQGGTLIAAGASSLFDERGKRRTDFGLGDVFGVSYGETIAGDFVYLKLDDPGLSKEVTAGPILVDGTCLIVKPTGNVRSLASVLEAESLRTDATTILWGDASPDPTLNHPGLVLNRFGAGNCWYLPFAPRAIGLPNAWTRQLMRALLARTVPEPLVTTTAPPGVEMTLTRQEDRLVLHLVNHHAAIAHDDTPLVLRDIVVRVYCARAGLPNAGAATLVPEGECQVSREDGRLVVRLAELAIHALVVIA